MSKEEAVIKEIESTLKSKKLSEQKIATVYVMCEQYLEEIDFSGVVLDN